MKDEPTQKTLKDYEIPIPKRSDFERLMLRQSRDSYLAVSRLRECVPDSACPVTANRTMVPRATLKPPLRLCGEPAAEIEACVTRQRVT